MGTTRTTTTPFNTSSVNPGPVTTPGTRLTTTNTASTGVPNTDFPTTTVAGRAPPNSKVLREDKNNTKGSKSFQNKNLNNQLSVKPIGQTIEDSKTDKQKKDKTWNTRIEERRKRIKKLTEKHRRKLAKRKRKKKIRRKTQNQKLFD